MFGLFASTFDPAKDIPDLSGKVILITGGNSGLGAESVKQLASHNPSQIYLAARTPSTASSTIDQIKQTCPNAPIVFLPLDLSSLASVKEAADTFNASSKRLDILMNNAGIMAVPAGTTREGYEIQFGTNHMGHALLTKLLMPTLERTAAEPGSDVRIINLSSEGENLAPQGGLVLDDAKSAMESYRTLTRYGQSKLANILFTKELARRYPAIKSIAIHPGVVNTELKRGIKQFLPGIFHYPLDLTARLFIKSTATGTLNQLWAATSGDAKTGTYYHPVGKESPGSPFARDEKLAEKLWNWTEEELKKQGY